MSGNYTIYHGYVWTDHTDGRHILTLASKPGLALASAIPLFISLAGTTFWSVIKRVWYHLRLLYLFKHEIDGTLTSHFERQQQVLLRNSSGDLAMSWSALSMFRYWTFRPPVRPGPVPIPWQLVFLIVVGVSYWAAWQAAGICSFYISQNSITNLVLIRGAQCGFPYLGNGHGTGTETALETAHFRSSILSQTRLAETWVSQCYGNSSDDSAACSLYPQPKLSFWSEPVAAAACPFASQSVCQDAAKNSSPHRIESDPIDSHLHLGINALPADRVTYRKVTTCSPIEAAPFAQEANASDTDEASLWLNGTILARFFFGPVAGSGEPWTYEYNKFAALDRLGYQIVSVGYFPAPNGDLSKNVWAPNSTFSTIADGDVSLFFLSSNSILYVNKTYDPIYAATDPHLLDGRTYYAGNYDVTILACVDRHQICDPNRNNATGCTAPQGYLQLGASLYNIGLNKNQIAAAQRIVGTLVFSSTLNSVSGRSEAALLASQTVSELIQELPLPIDQWRAEVENWYAVSLAKLQRNIIDFAGGSSDRATAEWGTAQFDSEELAQTCNSQFVMMPAGYQNFNFDAIIIVAVLGAVLIIVGFFFEGWFGSYIEEKLERLWLHDAPFQLQRLAYPHILFEDEEKDIPRTIHPLQSPPPTHPAPSNAALQSAIQPPPTFPAPSFTTSSQTAVQSSSTAPESASSIELLPINRPSSIHSTASSETPLLTEVQLLSISTPPNGSNTSQSTSYPTQPATTSNASMGSR
ncbi:hypothetical protein N431DRAFT_396305 [Stipitochalara longipes BDJ]|nr:hypothetical protein N431DRAFT_396305 [Stipitochalara longipes BDJ]